MNSLTSLLVLQIKLMPYLQLVNFPLQIVDFIVSTSDLLPQLLNLVLQRQRLELALENRMLGVALRYRPFLPCIVVALPEQHEGCLANLVSGCGVAEDWRDPRRFLYDA